VEGTSFAAPLVSATAALIRSRWPRLSADNVINRLITTADDLGEPGRDDLYGYGEVDPVAALTDPDVPTVTRNPLLPPSVAVDSALEPATNAQGAGGPVPDQSPSPATPSATPAVAAAAPDERAALASSAGADIPPLPPWWAFGTSSAAVLAVTLLLYRRRA